MPRKTSKCGCDDCGGHKTHAQCSSKGKKPKSASRSAAGKKNPFMKFMKDFRSSNKNKDWKVTVMAKKGGAAWRSMSVAEKGKYK